MTTRIIFWAVPIVLIAAILLVLYQISLQENNISLILERELSENKEEKPGVAEPFAKEVEPIVVKDEGTPILEIGEEEPPVEKTDALEINTAVSEDKETATEPADPPKVEEVMEPEVVRSETVTEAEKEVPVQTVEIEERIVPELVSHGALIESAELPWNVIFSNSEDSDSSQWHTILIQNEHKWDYTIFPRDSRMWQIAQSVTGLKIQLMNEVEEQDDILSRKEREKYAVQILSVERRHFSGAIQILHDLVHDGYYAYMHRTKEKFKNRYWYRVRVGFFKTTEAAQGIGEEIYFRYRDKIDLSKNYWAVLPTQRELNRQLVDFQALRSKPWFVELPLYDSQEKAVEDLPELTDISDFSYLAYKLMDEKFQYRIRLGFFETHNEAQNKLGQLRKMRDSFEQAKPVKL